MNCVTGLQTDGSSLHVLVTCGGKAEESPELPAAMAAKKVILIKNDVLCGLAAAFSRQRDKYSVCHWAVGSLCAQHCELLHNQVQYVN